MENSSLKKNIEQIAFYLKKGIKNESDAIIVSKIINKEAAGEYNSYRKNYFADENCISKIISLAKEYEENEIVLRNLVSALGFICSKYDFFNNKAFDCLVSNVDCKSSKVKIAIAKNIYKFPQFKDWDHCWKYVLSIPKLAPHKESIEYFYRMVDKYVNDISNKDALNIIAILEKYMDKNTISEYRENDYLTLIGKIKKNQFK